MRAEVAGCRGLSDFQKMLLTLFIMAVGGVWLARTFLVTPLPEIARKPEKFMKTTAFIIVKVREVMLHQGINLYMFQVGEGKARMWVITTKDPPKKGQKLLMEIELKESYKRPDTPKGEGILEKEYLPVLVEKSRFTLPF